MKGDFIVFLCYCRKCLASSEYPLLVKSMLQPRETQSDDGQLLTKETEGYFKDALNFDKLICNSCNNKDMMVVGFKFIILQTKT